MTTLLSSNMSSDSSDSSVPIPSVTTVIPSDMPAIDSMFVASPEPAVCPPPLLSTMIGLSNLGNTCFLNSILQALRLSPAISEIFVKPEGAKIRADSPMAAFTSAFQVLMRDFWRSTPPANTKPTMVPRGFFQVLRNTLVETDAYWYTPGQQSDAGEAIQYLLDSLHEGLLFEPTMRLRGVAVTEEEISQHKALEAWMHSWSNKEPSAFRKGYSPIIKHFYGQTQTCVRCETCGTVSEKFDPWVVLKVPIPGGDVVGAPAPDTPACLKDAFHEESIPAYDCTECNKRASAATGATVTSIRTTATRFDRISKAPSTLILQYKRSIFKKATGTPTKIRCKIATDLDHIDLSPYMAYTRDPFTNSSIKDSPPVYEVSAIVEQWGGTHGGHYVSYVRQGSDWIEYDDSSTGRVDPARVISQDSYLLVLTRKDSAPDARRQMEDSIHAFRASLGTPVEA